MERAERASPRLTEGACLHSHDVKTSFVVRVNAGRMKGGIALGAGGKLISASICIEVR
jgi:hypothetical protein